MNVFTKITFARYYNVVRQSRHPDSNRNSIGGLIIMIESPYFLHVVSFKRDLEIERPCFHSLKYDFDGKEYNFSFVMINYILPLRVRVDPFSNRIIVFN